MRDLNSDEPPETGPLSIAFSALQGWRLYMHATFAHLFEGVGVIRPAARRLNDFLVTLLCEAWDMTRHPNFLVCAMLMVMVRLFPSVPPHFLKRIDCNY